MDIANQGHFFYYKCSHSNLLSYDNSFDHCDRKGCKAWNTADSLITPMAYTNIFLLCFFSWFVLLTHWEKESSSCFVKQECLPANACFILIFTFKISSTCKHMPITFFHWIKNRWVVDRHVPGAKLVFHEVQHSGLGLTLIICFVSALSRKG